MPRPWINREAETEVLGPPQQESVEPGMQFGPGRRVSPQQQSVDLLLESLSPLRGPGRQDCRPGEPGAEPTGIASGRPISCRTSLGWRQIPVLTISKIWLRRRDS